MGEGPILFWISRDYDKKVAIYGYVSKWLSRLMFQIKTGFVIYIKGMVVDEDF